MRIALCSPVSISYYGGAEKRLCELAQKLADIGHRVKVHSLPYAYEGSKVDPKNLLGDISYTESWIHNIQADVAYVYYQPLVWRPFYIRGPSIAGVHSAGLFQYITFPVYTAFKLFGTFDLAFFEAVHLQNSVQRVRHDRTYCIPGWVDTEYFKPHMDKAESFSVLFVGRHRKEKGWETFLEVCRTLKHRGYPFEFECTGSGEAFVRGLGLIKNEMPEVYSAAHVVVYPSTADTFGLVIAESLACGTPIITTPTSAHRQLELPLFYASTVKGCVEKVLLIYEIWKRKPSLYRRICSEGRTKVKKYDIEKIFPKMETMLKEVSEI